ncbi:GNAT family N-acetyltransferase [Brevibacillus ginsengisoli]|uniref:GNAT family N-acetyltransferase n=1 Tax=Brevibacillus ginsengisoli TaxID=363854 RepID=UPI003CE9CA6D
MNFTPLHGKRISLIPLEIAHAESLLQCSEFPEIWEHLPSKPQTVAEMQSFIQTAISARDTGEEFPYAVFDNERNQIVGTTRYLRISPVHKNLNIGWTWYTPQVWRTSVNTECKYLLLQHAFEVWGAVRVEIIAALTNIRSQRAIERLGAKKEGILRKKYDESDYVVYSIIDEEWQDVKNRFQALLQYSRD